MECDWWKEMPKGQVLTWRCLRCGREVSVLASPLLRPASLDRRIRRALSGACGGNGGVGAAG